MENKNKKTSDIPIKLMKLCLILIVMLIVVIVIVSASDIKREITKRYIEYTRERVEPKWDIPEWAKERCNSHYVVARCNINLFWETDYSLIVSRSEDYRDYNGEYLAEGCGPRKDSKCDYYEEICGDYDISKIICNYEHR